MTPIFAPYAHPYTRPQRLGYLDRMKPTFAHDEKKMRIYNQGLYAGW